MDDSRDDPKGITLSRLCDILDLPSRRIQYLRESGVITPSIDVAGRGRVCRYSFEDAVKIYVAAVELDGFSSDKKKSILSEVFTSGTAKVATYSHLSIDVDSIRARIKKLAKLTYVPK